MVTRRSFVKFLAGAVVAKSLLVKVANDEIRFVADAVKQTTELIVDSVHGIMAGDIFTIAGCESSSGCLKEFKVDAILGNNRLSITQA